MLGIPQTTTDRLPAEHATARGAELRRVGDATRLAERYRTGIAGSGSTAVTRVRGVPD